MKVTAGFPKDSLKSFFDCYFFKTFLFSAINLRMSLLLGRLWVQNVYKQTKNEVLKESTRHFQKLATYIY